MSTNTENGPENLRPGIYERIIDDAAAQELAAMDEGMSDRAALSASPVDTADAISLYVGGAVRNSLAGKSVEEQIETANRVLGVLAAGGQPPERLRNDMLLAVHGGSFGTAPESLRCRPSTPVSCNAVFTAAAQDPQLYYELNREICSADRIWLVVSFIRWSGLDLLYDALRRFTQRGGVLRVLTTTYMGVTEMSALDRLAGLPNTRIRISLDGDSTRLHAKAYVFERDSGYSTAYIGSSNVSRPALTAGYEWNTKIAAADSPDTYEKILVTCEEYWADPGFSLYDESNRDAVREALKAAGRGAPAKPSDLPSGSCVPFPYQQEVLDRLEAERVLHDRWKNLIVAATGTGKTIMAAFDYARYRRTHPGGICRLLFIAHRREILEQSLETFRRVLGDAAFGELHAGDRRASKLDHVFMSIQGANASGLCDRVAESHFDYLVVDEFHHAAAPSYEELLKYFRPKILLGLTATPERADHKSILPFFDGRIAAELRLPAAIDQALLCPFHYFGLPDTVDLDQVKWKRGGYDTQELDRLYALDTHIAGKRADHILENLRERASDLDSVKALGFCVSVAHAEFMARCFRDRGIPCLAVSGKTPAPERKAALRDLAEGRIRVIFCVDLLNEGVDIPEVNVVLFLRPTESLTVFLQQLGRGLRLSPDKDHLLVLDFIGMANRRYRFDEKFGALVRRPEGLGRQIREQFPLMPRGCSIRLAEKPMEIVLDTISRGFGTKAVLQQQLEEYVAEYGHAPTFAEFLRYAHIGPADLYRVGLFTRLLMNVGALPPEDIPLETEVRKGLLRLAGTNSPRWMRYLAAALPAWRHADFAELPEDEQLMIVMFYLTIWDDNVAGAADPAVRERLAAVASSEILTGEITQLLSFLIEENMRITFPLDAGYACPLEIHGTYNRNQIFAALGNFRPRGQQMGVLRVPDRNTEALFVTLNKEERHFGESIRYRDYAIDATHFHWQSQNSTSPESASGQRYIHQEALGVKILLFIRQTKEDSRHTAVPYYFAGPAQFVSSSGSKPMNIVWKLAVPMGIDFLQEASRLVV